MITMKDDVCAVNIHQMKIGRLTYKVCSLFSETSDETAQKKIKRHIKRDLESV